AGHGEYLMSAGACAPGDRMNEMPGKERTFSAGRGLVHGAVLRVKIIAGAGRRGPATLAGGRRRGLPPGPNNPGRYLETRGARRHTWRAVAPPPVIPADLDLRPLARSLAAVVPAGAGAL